MTSYAIAGGAYLKR